MKAAQIIDHEKNFSKSNLDQILDGCTASCLRVVSILGPQSSGKSTLLNCLFGTSFKIMDALDRRQTTQGIWACRGEDSDIIVFDVEGTDGRERGEDQDFERKSALFSLAMSQVLIVNIWENSVGLYHAANMSLLRTVMDVHSQIIDPSRKTKTVLLFVIRDYVGKTPRENLSKVLTDDLCRIWDSIRKFDSSPRSALSECFDFRFSFLPHKVLQSEEFETSVRLMRLSMEDQTSYNYIFPLRSGEGILKSDFSIFASGIWCRIESNKDLDLPTERELLAQYRCDEISENILVVFHHLFDEEHKLASKSNVISELGSRIIQAIFRAKGNSLRIALLIVVERFGDETSRYSAKVVERKLKELDERLLQSIEDLVRMQIENYRKLAIDCFNETINMAGVDFTKQIDIAYDRADELFCRGLKETCVTKLGWDYDKLYSSFKILLEQHVIAIKIEEARRLIQKQMKKVKRILETIKSDSFGFKDTASFWDLFWDLFNSISKNSEEFTNSLCLGLNISKGKMELIKQEFEHELCDEVSETIRSELSNQRVADRLIYFFERQFLYDESELPRVWNDASEVDFYFKKAKDNALQHLNSLGNYEIPDWLSHSSLRKIVDDDLFAFTSENSTFNILKSLERHFERCYIDAKRSTVASQTRIPSWVFLLLLVLGWNELMTILFSPLYLFLFILFLLSFVIVKMLNLIPYIRMTCDYALELAKQKISSFDQIQHVKKE